MKYLEFIMNIFSILFITTVLCCGAVIFIRQDDLAYGARVRQINADFSAHVKKSMPDAYYCTKQGRLDADKMGLCSKLIDTEYVSDKLEDIGKRTIKRECVVYFKGDC